MTAAESTLTIDPTVDIETQSIEGQPYIFVTYDGEAIEGVIEFVRVPCENHARGHIATPRVRFPDGTHAQPRIDYVVA